MLESDAVVRFSPSRAEFRISSIVGVERLRNLVAFLVAMIRVCAGSIGRWEYVLGRHYWCPIAAAAKVR